MPINLPKEKHDHQTLKFPEGFLWGAATSAHQVEGNNVTSDWWDWELKNQPPQLRSGRAVDQYNLYESDFMLAKSLNQNAHRLSIEWARIEPQEGKFDEIEIEHYIKVLKFLKSLNFTVMLTLWHFTLPKWVADKGGWENGKTADYFARFVKKIVPEIKEYVDLWITINEPGLYVFMGYLGGDEAGSWPPHKKNKFSAVKAYLNLVNGHKKAYQAIHQLIPNAKAGIANNISSFEPFHKHSLIEQASVTIIDIFSNHMFYFLTKGFHDFLGINYYFNWRFDKKGKQFLPKVVNFNNQTADVSDLGWEIYPEGMFDVLIDFANHLPVYITECGIASTNDDRRTRFLINYLQEIYRGIKAGVNVKGFFYWSLIDNFEWHRGFTPRFGLIEIDYPTQKRTPRPSAYVYAEIIKHNGILHHLLRLLGHTVTVKEVLCYKHDGPRAFCEHLKN